MALTPTQKRVLYIGIPIVAVIALFTVLRRKATSSSAGATATGSTQAAAGVDPGQLADFETNVTGAFTTLEQELQALQNQSTAPQTAQQGTTTTTPPTPSGIDALRTALRIDPSATVAAVPGQPYALDVTGGLFGGDPTQPPYREVVTNVGNYTSQINGQETPIDQELHSSDPAVRARAAQIISDASHSDGYGGTAPTYGPVAASSVAARPAAAPGNNLGFDAQRRVPSHTSPGDNLGWDAHRAAGVS